MQGLQTRGIVSRDRYFLKVQQCLLYLIYTDVFRKVSQLYCWLLKFKCFVSFYEILCHSETSPLPRTMDFWNKLVLSEKQIECLHFKKISISCLPLKFSNPYVQYSYTSHKHSMNVQKLLGFTSKATKVWLLLWYYIKGQRNEFLLPCIIFPRPQVVPLAPSRLCFSWENSPINVYARVVDTRGKMIAVIVDSWGIFIPRCQQL